MDNGFARKDHMLRQGDGAENKVGGQLEQTDVFIWPTEATVKRKEQSKMSAKNNLLWNLGEGVGVAGVLIMWKSFPHMTSPCLVLTLKLFLLTRGGTVHLWAALL